MTGLDIVEGKCPLQGSLFRDFVRFFGKQSVNCL